MKDLAHHLKKLNRRVIRSIHREEMEDESYAEKLPSPPARKQTMREQKKIAKRAMSTERTTRTPVHKTKEERNAEMKHRVPIFDRNSMKPKASKPSRKKTPRI